MNSNPYTIPALIILAAVLFGCGSWACLAVTKPSGQHARRREPNAEGERFGAYLRGEDPDEQPAPAPYDPVDDIWWSVKPPPPPVTVMTPAAADPVPAIAATPALSLRVLSRVRDALMPEAWKEDAVATFTPADPDATCVDLPAVTDAPQYLAAPQ